MPRPNPRFQQAINEREFFTGAGYTNEEQKMKNEYDNAENEIKDMGSFSPKSYPIPSWWKDVALDVNRDFADPGYGYGWGYTTHQKALDYMKLVKKYYQANFNWHSYRCEYLPVEIGGGGINCQLAPRDGDYIDKADDLIAIIGKRISGFTLPEILPEVYAEEDPSVNSGLNGNEQESIAYPQSANVRIVISDISMFSTSIPINDISQLQILSNASNKWRYTLIGSSTNPPLMTLNGLINKINNMIASVVTPPPPIQQQPQPPSPPPMEEPPVTTDHVPPPDMPVEEPPITVTPTEPGQVNWIPEPFFSFINNLFR